MIEQTYFLDMIPGESTPPVVHVSQFDVKSRTLTFNLMKGGVAYVPDAGMSVTLDGMKPDNTVFSYPMTVDGSSVSIDVLTQMTVVSGHVRCEVSVSNQTGKIGSANFILAVEESPIDSGSISESDIPIFEDLKNQAQQAAASAEQSASDAEDFATDAETAATSVSAILPASAGTTGQVLTKTATGADWVDNQGLPSGGTAGQVLTKNSSTDGDASWQTPQSGGGGTWGSITGTLSDQTDLQNALNAKANTSTLATVESTTTASKAYSVGDYLVLNGQLYEVIADIASGETLVVGTNITARNVGEELTALNNGLSHKQNTLTITSLTSTVVGSGVTINSQSLALYGKVLQFSIDVTLASQISQYGSLVSLGGKSAAAGWCHPIFSMAFVPSSQYAIYGDSGNQNIRAAQTLPAGRYFLIGMILTT